jgi:hypothetical protein
MPALMTRPHAKILCLSSFVSLALLACTSEPPTPTPTPVAEQTATSESETGEAAQPASKGKPKIACDQAIYDFGAIKLTDTVEHVFKIRNVGDGDLKIERVQKT